MLTVVGGRFRMLLLPGILWRKSIPTFPCDGKNPQKRYWVTEWFSIVVIPSAQVLLFCSLLLSELFIGAVSNCFLYYTLICYDHTVQSSRTVHEYFFRIYLCRLKWIFSRPTDTSILILILHVLVVDYYGAVIFSLWCHPPAFWQFSIGENLTSALIR